ncbi:MAG: Hint domain-containing protein [Loktanella sp.]|nr:Hint domain-containing protein [Loktanella sp.]
MRTLGFSPTIFDNFNFVCFAAGTLLRTADGQIAVEDVQKDDLLWTRDEGLQPVGWIGSQRVSSAMLAVFPNLRPIRIRAGALGDQVPVADLIVSPQHRVLVRSSIAERMFDSPEVLVAAKHLLALDGIEVAEDMAEVEYFHVMFDKHQVVMSNGAETESLYPGPESIKALPAEAVTEIYTLFPELRADNADILIESARPLVKGRQGRRMAERHQQNQKALVG